jgi:hypothetical protein
MAMLLTQIKLGKRVQFESAQPVLLNRYNTKTAIAENTNGKKFKKK